MRVAFASLLAACVIACSGRVAPEIESMRVEGVIAPVADAGASAPTMEKVDATANGKEEAAATLPSDPALEAACEAIVDATCSLDTKACCDSRGVAFDEVGCESKARASCETLLESVVAGERSLDSSKVVDCVSRWHSIASKCLVAKADVVEALIACTDTFPATHPVAAPSPCHVDEDCLVSRGWLGVCRSGDTHGVCVWFPRPASGIYDSPSSHVPNGIVCLPTDAECNQATAHAVHTRCAPALPLGATCGTAVDGCCGYGSTCSNNSPIGAGTCIAGQAEGTPCGDSYWCASTWCEAEVCAPRPADDPSPAFTALATPSLCSGADGSYVPWLAR